MCCPGMDSGNLAGALDCRDIERSELDGSCEMVARVRVLEILR